GPSWRGGRHGERDILQACYRNSLLKAAELSCASIAFPLIATGVYGFPKDEALQIALAEINRFLLKQEMLVILVVFDQKSFVLSEKLISGIDAFLEEHEADALADEEYGSAYAEELRRENAWRRRRQREQAPVLQSQALPAGKTLEEFMAREEESFRDMLFRLIDERGLSDPEVYTRANLTRQVFSKIRNNPDYHPKKATAFALSIALELDMQTMLDLLSRAGLTFSPGNRTDLIIEYFVMNGSYDTGQIDAALFHYGQPTLFSEE
ncbi:MAG: macro domain-containing protein, partial [Eubacterium sp.]|nr:macro domain-containing protein [Eubacterium sp.]